MVPVGELRSIKKQLTTMLHGSAQPLPRPFILTMKELRPFRRDLGREDGVGMVAQRSLGGLEPLLGTREIAALARYHRRRAGDSRVRPRIA